MARIVQAPASPATRLALFVLVAALTFAVGILAGRITHRHHPAPAHPAPAHPASARQEMAPGMKMGDRR